MPNVCNVFGCTGNYRDRPARIFKLPSHPSDRQIWIDRLPPRVRFELNPNTFHLCELHWPENFEAKKVPGGHTRPVHPPSIFPNVPKSCLPTPKPKPRSTNVNDIEARQAAHLKKVDGIVSFESFKPEKHLKKVSQDVMITRTKTQCVCLFMKADYSDVILSVIIEDVPTMTDPVTLKAFKDGIRIPLAKYLHPYNGFSSYQVLVDFKCFKRESKKE